VIGRQDTVIPLWGLPRTVTELPLL
jgi:hypothetical protein